MEPLDEEQNNSYNIDWYNLLSGTGYGYFFSGTLTCEAENGHF